tara:strand:- start:17 stop:631 length:615 start_codon:yes stop_codon:yes gene_type:complete
MIENIHEYFKTPIMCEEIPQWIDSLNKASDEHITKAKQEKNTFGQVHHSTSLVQDPNFNVFHKEVGNKAAEFLTYLGYDISNHALFFSESWVQEFTEKGGGHHAAHVHSNNHVSGFYYLKTDKDCSKPAFYDPRIAASMMHLPELDPTKVSYVNEKIHYIPKEGQLFLFPSYLVHEYSVQEGQGFRFIHFNIQAINKEILQNDF